MADQETEDWEKKSERFEVRLAHSKKQAFQDACDAQGDTPSLAVRRFIDGYLNRADADVLSSAGRALVHILRRNWLPTTIAFVTAFSVAYSLRATL